MKNTPRFLAALLLAIALNASATRALAGNDPNWGQVVAERARLYGHRNWIVIADFAYPAQSRECIETISTNAGQIDVVHQVLTVLEGMKHVRPIVYTDSEPAHVPDKDAPGISEYRKELAAVLEIQSIAFKGSTGDPRIFRFESK